MTIVTVNYPTGAFPTGILCDDYAYQYSNTFECAGGQNKMSFVFFNSGAVSGINWVVQVSNDPNESDDGFYNVSSGTVATVAKIGTSLDYGYTFARAGMRPDYSTCTPISGFAWVGVHY